MISFPNAKINLGLRILNKREDGYHNIESCILPVSWCDILEMVTSDTLKITFSGLPVPGPSSENFCLKAYQVINASYSIPPVHLHLHKVIPMGAGIGGGSADAAFTIRLLNDYFSLGMNTDEMESHASKVGSDCPFFIRNKTAIAMGRGTELQLLDLDLKEKKIFIIYPGIHISTFEAYSNLFITPRSEITFHEIFHKPVNQWKDLLTNDFEKYVFKKYPQIEELKKALYLGGAIYAGMSGSGASVYGIFEKGDDFPEIPGQYISWSGNL